jgi:hypothetical protein
VALPQVKPISQDAEFVGSSALQRGYEGAAFALPCCEQTSESIEQWLVVHAAAGSVVVVRHTRWHLYEYHLDEIAKVNARSDRVYLKQHGGFDFSGRGISGPKGSLTLLEPTTTVLTAAMQGRTWQHGKPAFKRPLSAREIELSRQFYEPDTPRQKRNDG